MDISFYIRLKYKNDMKWCKISPLTYENLLQKVKEEFNILEKEIYFVDSVGAKIDADFILEYIEINERGVIIEVKEETLDYIELDTLPSTVTVENDLDVSFSDVGSIISSEETSDTKLVKNYLLSILPGKQLIEEYQNTEQLCDRSRKLLVNLVVSYLVENSPNSKPSKLEKEICAKSIIDLFPKLKDRKSNLGYEAFYNPSTGSGFITNRLKTIKRNSTTNLKSLDKRRCTDNKENIDLVEVQEDIKFLKFSTKDTPTAEIFQRMKNTFAYRRTISNKLEEFPRFLDTYGLINQDFVLIYPNKDYPTKERFVEFREKIFNIYNNTITKKTFNPILDGVDVWDKNINAIIALIHLLPPTAQGRYKAQRETRTSAESRFIYFQKTGTPLTDIFAKKVTKQPFLVGIGTSKASIYQYYVCMDNNLFEAGKESFDGIDLLFKIHFVFDVQYDINLKGVYSFLESEFYKIQDHVNITPRMRELRAKLYNN